MKTKLFFIALTASMFAVSSCQKTDLKSYEKIAPPASTLNSKAMLSGFTNGCSPVEAVLFTELNSNAGTITIGNLDKDNLYVTFTCDNNWTLVQTNLFVGDCALIPFKLDGTPDVDNYPNITVHDNITTYTYTIPASLIPPGSWGCVSAYALVKELGGSDQPFSAWGINRGIVTSGSDYDAFSFQYQGCQ